MTLELLRRLMPGVTEINAALHLASLNEGMERWAITTPARRAAFLAQIGHESLDLSRTEEGLSYSAERLCAVWPSRFPTLEAARPYARNPEALANRVYANRLGNGPEASGDGWRFRGRGVIQITGRASYAAYARWATETPDWLAEPPDAALSACWFWGSRQLNDLADAGAFEAITRRINGGLHGHPDRVRRWDIARAALDELAA